MDPFTSIAVGFCLGAVVVGTALTALIGKYKIDNMRAYRVIDLTNRRLRRIDKERSTALAALIDAEIEIESLKSEVERLRNEKLSAWGIPGGLS